MAGEDYDSKNLRFTIAAATRRRVKRVKIRKAVER